MLGKLSLTLKLKLQSLNMMDNAKVKAKMKVEAFDLNTQLK